MEEFVKIKIQSLFKLMLFISQLESPQSQSLSTVIKHILSVIEKLVNEISLQFKTDPKARTVGNKPKLSLTKPGATPVTVDTHNAYEWMKFSFQSFKRFLSKVNPEFLLDNTLFPNLFSISDQFEYLEKEPLILLSYFQVLSQYIAIISSKFLISPSTDRDSVKKYSPEAINGILLFLSRLIGPIQNYYNGIYIKTLKIQLSNQESATNPHKLLPMVLETIGNLLVVQYCINISYNLIKYNKNDGPQLPFIFSKSKWAKLNQKECEFPFPVSLHCFKQSLKFIPVIVKEKFYDCLNMVILAILDPLYSEKHYEFLVEFFKNEHSVDHPLLYNIKIPDLNHSLEETTEEKSLFLSNPSINDLTTEKKSTYITIFRSLNSMITYHTDELFIMKESDRRELENQFCSLLEIIVTGCPHLLMIGEDTIPRGANSFNYPVGYKYKPSPLATILSNSQISLFQQSQSSLHCDFNGLFKNFNDIFEHVTDVTNQKEFKESNVISVLNAFLTNISTKIYDPETNSPLSTKYLNDFTEAIKCIIKLCIYSLQPLQQHTISNTYMTSLSHLKKYYSSSGSTESPVSLSNNIFNQINESDQKDYFTNIFKLFLTIYNSCFEVRSTLYEFLPKISQLPKSNIKLSNHVDSSCGLRKINFCVLQCVLNICKMMNFEIKPTRSRNWEIEEEEEELTDLIQVSKPIINFNDNCNNSDYSQKHLIVATKDAPSVFIRSFFNDNLVSIAEIILDSSVDQSSKNIKRGFVHNEEILQKKCIVYRHKINTSILFILCQYDVPTESSYYFSELLLNTFKNPTQVIILDSFLDSHYMAQDYKHPIPPFIRTVFTSNFKNNNQVPLESPNIVEKLTASLITMCQVNNIPCCGILSLVESYLNVESIQAFESSLKSICPQLELTNTTSKCGDTDETSTGQNNNNNQVLTDSSIEYDFNNPYRDNDFFCYGGDDKKGYYTPSNAIEFKDKKSVPDRCKFLHKEDDILKKSCCSQEDIDTFDDRLETIVNQTIGMLIECGTLKRLKGGFRTVTETGETPDLQTNTSIPLIEVLDTRYHVKMCLNHLKDLQCFRCSQDHKTILREPKLQVQKMTPGAQTSGNLRQNPHIFFTPGNQSKNGDTYHGSPMEYDPNGEERMGANYQIGKSVTLCSDYYEELSKYCGFIKVRDAEYPIQYPANYGGNYFIGTGITTFSVTVPPITNDFFLSNDLLDALYTSNTNCFHRPIPKYKEPECNVIVNNAWIYPYHDPPQTNDSAEFQKESTNSTTSSSTLLLPSSISIIISIFFSIVYFLK
eukprot:gene9756-11984_t